MGRGPTPANYLGQRNDCDEQWCYRCKSYVELSEFAPAMIAGTSKPIECNSCRRLRRHNLTREQYEALPGSDGSCAICTFGEAIHIDHDHSCCPLGSRTCGRCARAVLCHRCNIGVGYMEGLISDGSFSSAIAYVKKELF